jgi:two-component system LytT family sensor kinase
LRQGLGDLFGEMQPNGSLVFCLQTNARRRTTLAIAAIYGTTLFAVAIPLKIWNNTRNEKKLEEQERLLVEARLAALTSQINPHFLFNTLNSVSSLIRTNPNQARVMVVKLSKVLRRLLRKHENFSPAARRVKLH